MAKIQIQTCLLAKASQFLHSFFGLPRLINNPLPFIVIKVNVFTSEGKYIQLYPTYFAEQYHRNR
jgi:hypothetical protein